MKMLNDPSPTLMPSEDLTTETDIDVDELIVSDVEDISSDTGESGSHYSPTSQGTILLHNSYLYHHKTTFFRS